VCLGFNASSIPAGLTMWRHQEEELPVLAALLLEEPLKLSQQ